SSVAASENLNKRFKNSLPGRKRERSGANTRPEQRTRQSSNQERRKNQYRDHHRRRAMEDVWKQFEENKITHSAAHHLLAVKELRETRGYARVTDVARYLNITTGSASTNLKNLKSKGLIREDDNRFLDLSDEG